VLAVISLPFLWIAALLALCLLTFSGSTRPAPFGLALGAGLVSLTVAFISRNSEQQPCAPGPDRGGLNPRPWLIAGLCLAFVGLAGYSLLRQRSGSSR
jgi:hypothetical protein